MGIYIDGMEMPKGFTDVRIYADGRVISRTLLSLGEEIATAVPVPKHGDLIDRDALRDNNCDVFEINGADGTILAMDISIIDSAPTVIEADEGE